MTTLLDPVTGDEEVWSDPAPAPASVAPTPMPDATDAAPVPPPARRLRALLAIWLVALLAAMGFVAYGLGPFLQERSQRSLMRVMRADISRAANEATGLEGVTVPTRPVDRGAPVGVLEIGAIKLQQVVVEGASSSNTRGGPGHVPGTAGLGQPGNAVVAGRSTAFGAPFASIGKLRPGDAVLVTTPQGQSVYEVRSVRLVSLRETTDGEAAGPSSVETVYGPSDDDRLTLVTSAGARPWNQKTAWVVTARLEGTAFSPTPQGGRSDDELGRRGEPGARSTIVLTVLAFGLLLGCSIALYRRLEPRTAYVLTIAPVLAGTIIAAETVSRAFPAWM